MSYIGTTEIGKMFLGSVEIDKAYLGNDLVFDSDGGTPVIEPVFYTYLVFDGVAKVATDYILPSNCSIRVSLLGETNKAAQRVFHASGGGGLIQMIYGSATTTTNRRVQAYYDSTSVSSYFDRAFANSLNFFLTPSRCGYGSTANTFTKGNVHPTGGLVFGGWESGNPYSGKMGPFRIYGTDAQGATTFSNLATYTPIATFTPCTYNGEAGFWYEEGNKFFGNTAGAGTLTVSNS